MPARSFITLEERMGVQLIDRSKRPFVLTPEGKRFHEGSRVIVQRYDDLEREVRSLHEAVAARLTIASIYSVGLAHMSGCMREFLAAHPQGRRAAGVRCIRIACTKRSIRARPTWAW